VEEEDWGYPFTHPHFEPTCKGCSAVESILCDIMPDCHFHRPPLLLPIISGAGNINKVLGIRQVCINAFHLNSNTAISQARIRTYSRLRDCIIWICYILLTLATRAVTMSRSDHVICFNECRITNV
jgi:hypothetical protein